MVAEFLRRIAGKLKGDNRSTSDLRSNTESVEAVQQIDSGLVFWDLNNLEMAKVAQVELGYYVEIKNVKREEINNPHLLENYIMPVNMFLMKNAPSSGSENRISFNSGKAFIDLDNAWQLSPYAYNPQKESLLVRADRVFPGKPNS